MGPIAMQPIEVSLEHHLADNVDQRLQRFIEWGEPGGNAGINKYHTDTYERAVPWFQYSSKLTPHSHASARSWFVKPEYWGQPKLYFSPRHISEPRVLVPEAFIDDGTFLSFAKAYVNVYCELRQLRSIPRSTVTALCILEKSLRELHNSDTNPASLSHLCFERAGQFLLKSSLDDSTKFDIGKALEHIAMLIQNGGRFKGDKSHAGFPGFNIIPASFSYRSPIPAPKKFGRAEEKATPSENSKGQLTGEQVAAVGLAYRRSVDQTGTESINAFMAALIGLTLTTTSLRASDLQSLPYDALFEDPDQPGRFRLRVFRPKIEVAQVLPIPKKLNQIAQEQFQIVSRYSAEAREAFSDYIKQSPDGTKGIKDLFVPVRLKEIMANDYLNVGQVDELLGISQGNYFATRFDHLPKACFVERPGDVFECYVQWSRPAVLIEEVLSLCRCHGVELQLPSAARPDQYVHRAVVSKWIARFSQSLRSDLDQLYESECARQPAQHISTNALKDFLLQQFKSQQIFPHWPYITKDKKVRLDQALAVYHAAGRDAHVEAGEQVASWWLPMVVPITILNRWISGTNRYPALLFMKAGVKLEDGGYPSISVHQTRKFHHTQALLAGASLPLIDELAGRKTGWQSAHYDCRTPKQVLLQSMETFDPNSHFEVIGPVEQQAPPRTHIVQRREFLLESAAPKHVTEIGGCRTDWSMNPCAQFGDCMRCDSHVWRKGDTKRRSVIEELRTESIRLIEVGNAKLLAKPQSLSIQKQVRQLEEVVQRCDEIRILEADDAIAIGTLVTFPAAPTALSDAARLSLLRSDST